jgi:hypothetical protein
MTSLEYHTSVYLEYNVQPPHSRALQRNCRDTRYTFTPPFTTCGDLVDRLSPRSCDALHAHQRGSPRPTALRRVQHDPGDGAHGGSLLCGAHGTVLKFRPPSMRSDDRVERPSERGPVLKRVRSSYKCVILRSYQLYISEKHAMSLSKV